MMAGTLAHIKRLVSLRMLVSCRATEEVRFELMGLGTKKDRNNDKVPVQGAEQL